MQFIPPQNALAFRWIELLSDGGNSNMGGVGTSGTAGDYATDPNDILNYPWQNLIPYLPVYARGIGMRTYMVQYQTVDGIISTVTNSIFIPQLQETVGNFTINNGETTTLFPTVQLQVFPPVNAVAMSATNLTLQQTTANSSTVFNFGQISASTSSSSNDQWLAPAPEIAFKLDSRGAQSIQMRFRDPNGDVVQPAVVKTVIYDPFPPFPVGVPPLTINSGAASTTSSLVTLNIKFPESAHSFRVSQDPNFVNVDEFLEIPSSTKTTLAGVTWKIYEFNTPYILSGAAGPKIVYVQARNELGDRSAVYSALIDYTP